MKATIRNKLIAQLVEAGYITRWQIAVKLNETEPETFRPIFRKSVVTGEVLLDRRPGYLKASA